MAKNVVINGVTYSSVPRVTIPLSGGTGEANFVDTDSGDAVAADLRNGKKAWVKGQEVTGSATANTAASVTVAGKTVTIPAGIYDEPVTKSIADGAVTPNAAVTGDVIGDTSTAYPVTVTPKASVTTPGYVSSVADGAQVKKYIQVESKSATPSDTDQNITPGTGKLLSSVKVNKVVMDGTATPGDVLSGKTFYNTKIGKKEVGTATVPVVSQDTTTKVLSIA